LTMTAMPIKPEEDQEYRSSPWILPVYVLSSQKDESRHFIPKEAKCTIDTGNLQGNLVSKNFVTDVLGFHESHFQPLTKAEEAGGIGVTGHRLTPQGAIFLTWYHSNSTRVFRNMRFLISEHPMYDVIIGSESIHQNRILDVPNLGDHLEEPNEEPGSEDRDAMLDKVNTLREKLAQIEKKVYGPKRSKDPKTLEQHRNEYHKTKAELEIAEKKYDIENRRFQQHRYWTKFKEGKGRNKKELDVLREEWQTDFPAEKDIPALDLITL